MDQTIYKRPGLTTLLVLFNVIGGIASLLIFLLAFSNVGFPAVQIEDNLLMVLFAGLTVLQTLCAYGLFRLRHYSWIIQQILAYLWLLGFPFGTIVAILTVRYLRKPAVKILFSGKPQDRLLPEEIVVLEEFGKSRTVALTVSVLILGLLEFAVVLGGVLAPGMINAVPRSHQKRTMADMRSIGFAVESYAVDHNVYPTANSMQELAQLIEPHYIRTMPKRDGWDREFRYVAWQKDAASPGLDAYRIASSGKDGKWEHGDIREYTQNRTTSFDSDIVYEWGSFIQCPEGVRE